MGDIASLLERSRRGDDNAWGKVVTLLYADLYRLACRIVLHMARAEALDATALVHEWWLRVARDGKRPMDRAHLFALAGRAMQQIVINHLRDGLAAKRGRGATEETWDDPPAAPGRDAAGLVDLDHCMAQLAVEDPRLAQVVDYRVFGGLTENETAAAMRLSPRLVQRLWARARDRLLAMQ